MKAVIVLNGTPPVSERLRSLADRYPVYAADGGAMACRDADIRPEWVAGDLDSQGDQGLPGDWEVHVHAEQDRTDFQKVLGDLPEEVEELLILGGLGRRTDHFLTNLMIAAGLPETVRVEFERGDQVLTRVTAALPFAEAPGVGATVSLLPFPAARGIVTTGLRWDLDGADMGVGGRLGQSNQATGPVRIRLESGGLYVWWLREVATPKGSPKESPEVTPGVAKTVPWE